jgi:endonuclease/exonuclease/phosphatase (EEP) superfamily protein YafD
MVSKGLASATVETSLGRLTLEITHLQRSTAPIATTRSGSRRPVEIVLGRTRRTLDEALLIAGDFNSRGDELPRRALR